MSLLEKLLSSYPFLLQSPLNARLKLSFSPYRFSLRLYFVDSFLVSIVLSGPMLSRFKGRFGLGVGSVFPVFLKACF